MIECGGHGERMCMCSRPGPEEETGPPPGTGEGVEDSLIRGGLLVLGRSPGEIVAPWRGCGTDLAREADLGQQDLLARALGEPAQIITDRLQRAAELGDIAGRLVGERPVT